MNRGRSFLYGIDSAWPLRKKVIITARNTYFAAKPGAEETIEVLSSGDLNHSPGRAKIANFYYDSRSLL